MKTFWKPFLQTLAVVAALFATSIAISFGEEGFTLTGYRKGVNIVQVGVATSAAVTNDVILVNANSSAVTLPLASTMVGKELTVKLVAPATTGSVLYTNIDGATSYSLSASNKYVRVVSDGTNYWNVGNN